MKTSELTGAALNWAVAIADGWKPEKLRDDRGEYWWLFKESRGMNPKHYHPSSNWAQGGPIIEREMLTVVYNEREEDAEGWRTIAYHTGDMEYGPTPLIAAMRCFVASKLGDEVEIPKEITT